MSGHSFDPETGEIFEPNLRNPQVQRAIPGPAKIDRIDRVVERAELPPIPEIEHSVDIAQIALALVLAQSRIGHASKDATNPHFKSKYMTLAAVYDACRTQLAEAEIAVIQAPFNDGDDIGVVTMLVHKSGQWFRSRLKVRPMKYDAQGAGSVITYLRRYTLSTMVGIAAEDDDGNAAVGRPGPAQTRTTAEKKAPDPVVTTTAKATEQEKAKLEYIRLQDELLACQAEAGVTALEHANKEAIALIGRVSGEALKKLGLKFEQRKTAVRQKGEPEADREELTRVARGVLGGGHEDEIVP